MFDKYANLFHAAFGSFKGVLCFMWILTAYDIAHAIAEHFTDNILINILIGVPVVITLIAAPLVIGSILKK